MAAKYIGIKSLGPPSPACRNATCPITLKTMSARGVSTFIASDGICYDLNGLSNWIRSLISQGHRVGSPLFRFPNRALIKQVDLEKLGLTDYDRITAEWRLRPEVLEATRARAHDAEIEAQAFMDEEDGNSYQIDTMVRWGVQVDRDPIVQLTGEQIERLDAAVVPNMVPPRAEGGVIRHYMDERIAVIRTRPIGFNEYDYVKDGIPIAEGLNYGINGPDFNLYQTPELYRAAMDAMNSAMGAARGGRRKTRKCKKHVKCTKRTRR